MDQSSKRDIKVYFKTFLKAAEAKDKKEISSLIYQAEDEKIAKIKSQIVEAVLKNDPYSTRDFAFSTRALEELIKTKIKTFENGDNTLTKDLLDKKILSQGEIDNFSNIFSFEEEETFIILIEKDNKIQLLFWEGLNNLITLEGVRIEKEAFPIEISQNRNKRKALKVALEFIETYFTEDCQKHQDLLADEVLDLTNNKVRSIRTELTKTNTCLVDNKIILEEGFTIENYKEDYLQELFTLEEFRNYLEKFGEGGEELLNQELFKKGDLFFIGWTQSPNAKNKNYILDDMLLFMLRMEDGTFKIKGFF